MFVNGPKNFLVDQDVPLEAVTSLWKGAITHETEGWQIDDQDRFSLAGVAGLLDQR